MRPSEIINALFACGLYAFWIIIVAAVISIGLARIFSDRRPQRRDYLSDGSEGTRLRSNEGGEGTSEGHGAGHGYSHNTNPVRTQGSAAK